MSLEHEGRRKPSSGRDRPSRRADFEPFRLLFLCTGNTCRSPMASGLAKQLLDSWGWEGIEVRSAGVAAFPGGSASRGALRAAGGQGINLTSHRSAQLTADLVRWADLILTMSDGQARTAEELGGVGKVELVTRFAAAGAPDGEGSDAGVLDPIGGDHALYEETLQQLRGLVERALRRLEPMKSE